MELPPLWRVDQELVESATEEIQAQERKIRAKLKERPPSEQDLSSLTSSLSDLRTVKRRLEGTHFNFQPITLSHSDTLFQLKHLTLSHTPSSLTEDTKLKIVEKLTQLFGNQIKRLVYACLLTCPIFAQSQAESSARSSSNPLYVVFVACDEQFFSLATSHQRELCETVDEGFLFATEVRHFCSQLCQGNVRAVEALCAPPESLILCSQEWASLAKFLDPVSLLHKSFVEKCLGQTLGGLVKRKNKGRHVLRDDASLEKFCDAFRLLGYAEKAQKGEAIVPWPGHLQEDDDATHSVDGKEICQLLHQGFVEGSVQKDCLLQHVVRWRERLLQGVEEEGLSSSPPSWTRDMEQWLSGVRLDGVELSTSSSAVPAADREKLSAFLVSMGISSMTPEDVLVVARAGSHMYGLATPTSDTDYIIVFREPTENIISSYKFPKVISYGVLYTQHTEFLDNRGQKMSEEMAAYEARMFCEMLLKGAVNIVEILFCEIDDLLYASEDWKVLAGHRNKFMSEQVILQYAGFIKTHRKIITKGKHAGTPREGKIFYQIYHKLLSLEQFISGQPPLVRCTGEERDYIMRIRTGPLQGDLEPSVLLSNAEKRLESAYEQLDNRVVRLCEFGDYRLLQTWLLHVRRTQPLRLATPPPTTVD